MRILILSPAPPNDLHRIRLKHIIKALEEDHELKVLNLTDDKNEQGIYKSKLRSYIDCLGGLFTTKPLEVCYCKETSINKIIRNTYKKYDLIIVKRLRAIQYINDSVNIPIILDTTDAMSMYYGKARKSVNILKKPLYYEEWLKYYFYEKKIANRIRNWVVCSKKDKQYLEKHLGIENKIYLVPNVVDTDHYKSQNDPIHHKILFSGILNKHVNQTALKFLVEEVLPYLNIEYSLDIVGPYPPFWIKQIDNKNINVTGYVKDIRKYIESASVVAVPTTVGTGTSNKVLQAWSHQRPIVATSKGARGLAAKHRKNIMISDDPKTFARSIEKLLSDKKLSEKISKNGRVTVLENYSIHSMRGAYNSVINEVMKNEK